MCNRSVASSVMSQTCGRHQFAPPPITNSEAEAEVIDGFSVLVICCTE